jgi:uncharacterized protein (UPF0147 family)
MSEECEKGTKPHLAIALAYGLSVRGWARANNVPRATAQRWSEDLEVRKMAEACRRRMMDKAVGRMSRRSAVAADTIFKLVQHAESESVQLRASRAIVLDSITVSKYNGLENRVTEMEERLSARAGNADHTT